MDFDKWLTKRYRHIPEQVLEYIRERIDTYDFNCFDIFRILKNSEYYNLYIPMVVYQKLKGRELAPITDETINKIVSEYQQFIYPENCYAITHEAMLLSIGDILKMDFSFQETYHIEI